MTRVLPLLAALVCLTPVAACAQSTAQPRAVPGPPKTYTAPTGQTAGDIGSFNSRWTAPAPDIRMQDVLASITRGNALLMTGLPTLQVAQALVNAVARGASASVFIPPSQGKSPLVTDLKRYGVSVYLLAQEITPTLTVNDSAAFVGPLLTGAGATLKQASTPQAAAMIQSALAGLKKWATPL